jgi:hypothetical protein
MARKPNPLDLPQRRIALHYGALRNALGNYGRLGTDVGLLAPAPTLIHGTLTIHGIPPEAKKVILFDRTGTVLHRFPTDGHGSLPGLPGTNVAWVEVYGRKNTPIRLGIPIS